MRSPQARAKQQCVGGQAELGTSKRLAETPVGVDGQVAGKRSRQTRDVGAEDQPTFRVRRSIPTR